jgi:hypothetical protein
MITLSCIVVGFSIPELMVTLSRNVFLFPILVFWFLCFKKSLCSGEFPIEQNGSNTLSFPIVVLPWITTKAPIMLFLPNFTLSPIIAVGCI